MAHTPGPWTVKPEKLFNGQHVAGRSAEVVSGDCTIAKVVRFGQKPCDPISEANARLISAAPDMLAALEAVVRVADRKTVEFDAARAAISKAKGE